MNDVTVCITSFQRPNYLIRAIQSVANAGVTRIAIATACPSPEVLEIIENAKTTLPWVSFDAASTDVDIGCNALWALAASLSRTKRIIILHDDDMLMPEFGLKYESYIKPRMDSGKCGFVTWEADHITDEGVHSPSPFFNRNPPGYYPSTKLHEFLNNRNAFSLSPILSILDRDTVIAACDEAEQTLTAPECFWKKQVLLGTEIIVYLRHVEKFPKWLYLHDLLSGYGKHMGSGTVEAEATKQHKALIRGYNLARDQGMKPFNGPRRGRIVIAKTL